MKYPRLRPFVDIDPAITIRDYTYLLDANNVMLIPETSKYNSFADVITAGMMPALHRCIEKLTEDGRLPKTMTVVNNAQIWKLLMNVVDAVLESSATIAQVHLGEPVVKTIAQREGRLYDPTWLPDYSWVMYTPSDKKCIVQLVPIVERACVRTLATWFKDLVSGKVAAQSGRNLSFRQLMRMVVRVWNTPLSYHPVELCCIQMDKHVEFPVEVLQQVIDITHEDTGYKRVAEFNAREKEHYDRRRDVFPKSGSAD